jgi:hypothetical protein
MMFLFKGEPSGGKSIAAASFPNCYIFDFESRIRSVANYWLPKGKRDIAYDTFGPKDFTKFDQKMDLLLANCKYETVILDTLTSLSDLVLFHVLNLKGADPKIKGKKIAGISVNTIEDYGAESSVLTELMMFMRQIKCKYKILVAHVVKTEKNDPTNNQSVVTRALLTAGKKVAAKLPGYFDEIYHFQQRPDFSMKPEFVALTSNSGDDFARTSINLPKEIKFTNGNFYEIIKPSLQEVLAYGTSNENHTSSNSSGRS